MNGTKNLLTFRYSEIINDLTIAFCQKHIIAAASASHARKMSDQMIQAARAGRQNIVESVGQSQTTIKGEMKFITVAKSSFEELLADYEDFLRQQQLPIYPVYDHRVTAFRKLSYRLSSVSNLSDQGSFILQPKLAGKAEEDANFLLTLCHLETYLLHKQMTMLEQKFIREGGFSQSLYSQPQSVRKPTKR